MPIPRHNEEMGETNLHVKLLKWTPEPEATIALAARLCYTETDIVSLANSFKPGEEKNFLKRLIALGHLSPIEHASFTFGIEGVSRSLLAQLTRHRIASFSVQSQRYVGKESIKSQDGVFNYIVPPRIKALGKKYVGLFDKQMREIQAWYDDWNKLLGDKGEASHEDARFVLPNAAETKLMLTMNARELHYFFRLRCCNRAQWEIRSMAIEMLKKVKGIAPTLFENAGPACVVGPCPEGEMTCGKIRSVRHFFKNL